MIRVVLDTNVIASGIADYPAAEKPPGLLLQHWLAGDFALVTSLVIIDELRTTLGNRYFSSRVPATLGELFLDLLTRMALDVELPADIAGTATHPEDDQILAAVATTACDYLVTGDKQLLKLGTYRGIHICTAAEFLVILDRLSAL